MTCVATPTQTVQTQTIQTINSINSVNQFLGASSMWGEPGNFNAMFWRPKQTDAGTIEAATWAKLAAITVAAINTAAAIEIAEKQYDIAKAYYKLAQKDWQRSKDIYQPCERALVNAACAASPYEADYDKLSNLATTTVSQVFGTVDLGSYTPCHTYDKSSYKRVALAQAMLYNDTSNFAYRAEEYRTISRDDVRWSRRENALNLGVGIMAQASSAASAASSAFGDVGTLVGNAATGAVEALGYFNNRNTTQYPSSKVNENTVKIGSAIAAGSQVNLSTPMGVIN